MKLIRFSVIILSMTSFLFTSCNKNVYTPPPTIVVNAGPSQSIQLPKDSVTLTGTVISGQSPNLLYSWTLIVGPNAPTISNGDSLVANVTGLIAGTYIFQFAATNSSSTVIGEDTVSVIIKPRDTTTITLRPADNPLEGWIDSNNPTAFEVGNSEISIGAWTIYGNAGASRIYMEFDYSNIPTSAIIDNAKLFLYSMPNPTGGNLVDAQYGPTNACYIQRITSNWLPASTSWNNQASTTTVDQATIPQSTSSTENDTTDVTTLVSDMEANGNNGFALQLQEEVIYNVRQYASSYYSDSTLRPKLVITYH
jgi:hypothetical protein